MRRTHIEFISFKNALNGPNDRRWAHEPRISDSNGTVIKLLKALRDRSRTASLMLVLAAAGLVSNPSLLAQTLPRDTPAASPANSSALTPPRAERGNSDLKAEAIARRGSFQHLERQLERLEPGDAESYFRLGEDAADLGRRLLAQRLFVLAASSRPAGYGRSSCLALADLADDLIERRRLIGVARMFPAAPGAPRLTLDGADDRVRRQAAASVSAMLGFYRRGEGARALKSLQMNDLTEDMLEDYGRSVGRISEVLEYVNTHPRCPTCRGLLIIRHAAGDQGILIDLGPSRPGSGKHFRLCTTCLGVWGPEITAEKVDRMLQFESALLAGKGETWSSQFEMDGGRVRPILDPAHLARSLNIDPTLDIYRNGQWVASGRLTR